MEEIILKVKESVGFMLLLFFMRKRTQFLNSSIIFNDVNQTYIRHKIEVCYVGVVSTLIYHYILNKEEHFGWVCLHA